MSEIVANSDNVVKTAIEDRHYNELLEKVERSFIESLDDGPVFITNAEDLFDLYLENLPAETEAERQVCNCRVCKSFFKKYGGLVVVNGDGDLIPIMWQVTDVGFYQPAIDAVRRRVATSNIVSEYRTYDPLWGTPESGGFTHFSVVPPKNFFKPSQLNSAEKEMADNKERFKTVMQTVVAVKQNSLEQALRVLEADAVNRAERFVAPVQFLHGLRALPKNRRGVNIAWKAITLAPEGFCHPRAAVTWSLIEDIESGLAFESVRRKFNAKVHPSMFQRAQTPPAAGTILQAEKLVEELGIARSFERRWARLDEVKKVWEPKPEPEAPKKDGLFGHLTPKGEKAEPVLNLPRTTMTWEKFFQKILPTSHKLQVMVPVRGSFVGVLTAEHEDAPPILKWDTPEDRYPISTYMYVDGSGAMQWNLNPSEWSDVSALAPLPADNAAEEGGMVMIIAGALDINDKAGNALFAETLKSELHGIRSVVEAYSKLAVIGGREQASANGLHIGKGNLHTLLRSFDGKYWNEYYIDRFE